MNYTDLFIGILIIIIPLILLVLCYKNHVSNYCQYDMKCLTNKLINNLNSMGSKIPDKIEKEHFFNFSDLFSGPVDKDGGGITSVDLINPSIPSTNASSNGASNSPSDRLLTSSDIKYSSNFPPNDNNNSEALPILPASDDFGKNAGKVVDPPLDITKTDTNKINNSKKIDISKNKDTESLKSFFGKGKCNFFNDTCPDNYLELGNFSVEGIDNISLKCGNIQTTKPGKAVAHIKNNNIYEIIVVDKGEGYLSDKPPKITINSRNEEKGHGATAEAIIDENGYLSVIKVINPGYNYTETPNILIEAPFMNSSCHLCCNL